jgi:hypothetical protein
MTHFCALGLPKFRGLLLSQLHHQPLLPQKAILLFRLLRGQLAHVVLLNFVYHSMGIHQLVSEAILGGVLSLYLLEGISRPHPAPMIEDGYRVPMAARVRCSAG